jgi:hypothetical protein
MQFHLIFTKINNVIKKDNNKCHEAAHDTLQTQTEIILIQSYSSTLSSIVYS